jgi:hypothetical protein
MSKLQRVVISLEKNPEIITVNVDTKNFIPRKDDLWSETVNRRSSGINGDFSAGC